MDKLFDHVSVKHENIGIISCMVNNDLYGLIESGGLPGIILNKQTVDFYGENIEWEHYLLVDRGWETYLFVRSKFCEHEGLVVEAEERGETQEVLNPVRLMLYLSFVEDGYNKYSLNYKILTLSYNDANYEAYNWEKYPIKSENGWFFLHGTSTKAAR